MRLPTSSGDGLDLTRIGAGAENEVVGEGGDAGKVEDLDIGGFLGFGCADGDEPGRGLSFDGGCDGCLVQNVLL